MAGIKTVEPFGEIGFEMEPLLPLQLSPTGIEQVGEFWVYPEKIAMIAAVVIELVYQ